MAKSLQVVPNITVTRCVCAHCHTRYTLGRTNCKCRVVHTIPNKTSTVTHSRIPRRQLGFLSAPDQLEVTDHQVVAGKGVKVRQGQVLQKGTKLGPYEGEIITGAQLDRMPTDKVNYCFAVSIFPKFFFSQTFFFCFRY